MNNFKSSPKGYEKYLNPPDQVISRIFYEKFGVFNRLYKYQLWHFITYWLLIAIGLAAMVVHAWAVWAQQFRLDFVYTLPFLVIFWGSFLKFYLPFFESKMSQFLRKEYNDKTGAHWGKILAALDLAEMIDILKKFKFFNKATCNELAAIFEDRSKHGNFFHFGPEMKMYKWIVTTFVGAIFSSLIGQIVKSANDKQFSVFLFITSALLLFLALCLFLVTKDSRQTKRIAELLRLAAVQAPR